MYYNIHIWKSRQFENAEMEQSIEHIYWDCLVKCSMEQSKTPLSTLKTSVPKFPPLTTRYKSS